MEYMETQETEYKDGWHLSPNTYSFELNFLLKWKPTSHKDTQLLFSELLTPSGLFLQHHIRTTPFCDNVFQDHIFNLSVLGSSQAFF